MLINGTLMRMRQENCKKRCKETLTAGIKNEFKICIIFATHLSLPAGPLHAWAVGPPKFIGSCTSSRSWIFPLAVSKRATFSVSAFMNRLAC